MRPGQTYTPNRNDVKFENEKKAIVNNAPKRCGRYYIISKCAKNVLIINAPL